jgi:hypothetical protein
MGIKYAMPPTIHSVPTHVEGHHHWKTFETPNVPDSVGILVSYWQGESLIGQRKIIVTRHYITDKWDGSPADWDSIVATATNSSDTDDVVQELTETGWGVNALWQQFRLLQGGA